MTDQARIPRVSVIMPSYNHAAFVGQAIESVLSQSFQDFEFVIADDCSTDGTPDVIQGFGDERISFTTLPENIGAVAVGNLCLARSRGEYVALINSDDMFRPGKLESQVAYLDANPDVAAVFGLARFVDEGGTELPAESNPFASLFIDEPMDRFAWLRQFFLYRNALCHPTVLARRHIFQELGPYDVTLKQMPDLDMWVRLCSQHPIHVMPEPLIDYRVLQNMRNESAPRPEVLRRTIWEHTKIRRHYWTMAPTTLQRAFGQDISPSIAERNLPMAVQLAFMAAEQGGAQLALFALETLEDALAQGLPYINLKELHKLTGLLDPFNNNVVYGMG